MLGRQSLCTHTAVSADSKPARTTNIQAGISNVRLLTFAEYFAFVHPQIVKVLKYGHHVCLNFAVAAYVQVMDGNNVYLGIRCTRDLKRGAYCGKVEIRFWLFVMQFRKVTLSCILY